MQVTRLHPGHQPSTRYGDPQVIRDLARSLREQAEQVEEESEQLERKAAAAPWTGLAADAMRQSVRLQAASLRRTAGLHVEAAAALERHADEVERIARLIARIEDGVMGRVQEARRRLSELAGAAGDSVDGLLDRFDPPPSGHRDWLTVRLPAGVPGLDSLSSLAAGVLR